MNDVFYSHSGEEMSSNYIEHDIHMMVSNDENVDPNSDNNLFALHIMENGVMFNIFAEHPFFKRGQFY